MVPTDGPGTSSAARFVAELLVVVVIVAAVPGAVVWPGRVLRRDAGVSSSSSSLAPAPTAREEAFDGTLGSTAMVLEHALARRLGAAASRLQCRRPAGAGPHARRMPFESRTTTSAAGSDRCCAPSVVTRRRYAAFAMLVVDASSSPRSAIGTGAASKIRRYAGRDAASGTGCGDDRPSAAALTIPRGIIIISIGGGVVGAPTSAASCATSASSCARLAARTTAYEAGGPARSAVLEACAV
mmetsp:Transcript_6229/g.26096  ORF Transcript_6229/g.26096 Transcript_6229/m.26096 type:complete len:241 (+) Transcript_6229:184-906(+)